MKKIIIASLSLMLMCPYTSNAQSKASKPKTTVHKKKKSVKFLPPEISIDGAIGGMSYPEPPPEEIRGNTSSVVENVIIDGEPNYPAGSDSFYDLLSRRVKIPEAAIQKGIQGNVKLSFVVGLQGNLSDFEIQNSLGSGCDEEAIRVVKSLGNWSAAQKNGQAFVSKKSISVAFGVPQLRESYTEQVKQEIPEPPREVMRVQEEEIYTAVEQYPEFPGGIAEYAKYIEKNLIYPEDAKTKKLEGNVYVQFMVFTDGSANNFQILKSMGSGTDEEAIRVLKSVPRWKPGNQSGRAVPSRLTIPVKFKLPE
jgi:TonB family protein